MAQLLQEISLDELSRALRAARERKGWTLEQLARELWLKGHPTSQNKLWRLENRPPKRVDTELLLWLEKVLEVEILAGDDKKQVFIDDVVRLIDAFIEHESMTPPPEMHGLRSIHEALSRLVAARTGTGGESVAGS